MRVSNILSFRYFDDINDAPEIKFEKLSILIGHNGSGKSTILEIIHFIFGNVLFADPNLELTYKNTTNQKSLIQHRNISSAGFRLQKNWNFTDKIQKIRIEIEIDKQDEENIKNLKINYNSFKEVLTKYSAFSIPDYGPYDFSKKNIVIDIELDNVNGIKVNEKPINQYYSSSGDLLLDYIIKSNYYGAALDLERENTHFSKIEPIQNTFGFIGSFRNYGSVGDKFNITSGSTVDNHQKNYRSSQYVKSTHTVETKEPAIFNHIRGVLSYAHSDLCISHNGGIKNANVNIKNNAYIKQINNYLKSIDLEITINRTDDHNPNYQFTFIKKGKDNFSFDFEALSAGQRSFLHIIFEVIGNNIKNGCLIIDEPELHLHNQLQQEYLNLINELSKARSCQFIMVTHSDVFVNEKTLNNVVRFALEKEGSEEYSNVFTRKIKADRESDLIKLLDNKRSGSIFFSKKVILVEGETDRYFFQSILDKKYPKLKQDITVMNIDGKKKYPRWKKFLESFGIENYFICDFDNVDDFGILTTLEYKEIIKECKEEIIKKIDRDCIKRENCTDAVKLFANLETILNKKNNTITVKEKNDLLCLFAYMLTTRLPSDSLNKYIKKHRKLKNKINKGIISKYDEGVFILKSGSLEAYTEKPKSLEDVVNFCNTKELNIFLKNKGNIKSQEINTIIERIVK